MPTQSSVKEKSGIKIKEPKKYQVIMLNDDFTTMEFVVDVLVDIFKKDRASAEQIMMFVHKNGRAVVGEYPYDIALTKTTEALDRAKAEGFPFRMTIQEA
ncbi:MAG: ATP-dependent Clp protease adaptor ClpS [Lachnospiraceae bacterium]|nr:ATP-dependent Clp protease adaptor ClpS [Lachnospiraceae bacterium]